MGLGYYMIATEKSKALTAVIPVLICIFACVKHSKGMRGRHDGMGWVFIGLEALYTYPESVNLWLVM